MTRFPTYAAEERLRALGVRPVPLQATPAPALPPHVVEAVEAALSAPMHATPARGLEPLRGALADELERATGRAVDPESELLLTNGAMQALGVVFRSLLEPGDEVVIPSPCFFFERPIRAAGGRPVYVPTETAGGAWCWDLGALEAAIGARTRVLLLCNPENPTGHVPSEGEIVAAASIAERHGLVLVTDEAYERALWEGAILASGFGHTERALVVRSLGKSLCMPHLRLGFVAGPADLVARCATTLEWDCLRVGVVPQVAALAALTGSRDWLDDEYAQLERDRAAALEAVSRIEGLDVVPPRGGPFLFLRSRLGERELAAQLERVGLPVVDGAHFQAPGWARLPFGGAEAGRDELVRSLEAWAASFR